MYVPVSQVVQGHLQHQLDQLYPFRKNFKKIALKIKYKSMCKNVQAAKTTIINLQNFQVFLQDQDHQVHPTYVHTYQNLKGSDYFLHYTNTYTEMKGIGTAAYRVSDNSWLSSGTFVTSLALNGKKTKIIAN